MLFEDRHVSFLFHVRELNLWISVHSWIFKDFKGIRNLCRITVPEWLTSAFLTLCCVEVASKS